MTAREIVRTALTVGGIWILVSALASIPGFAANLVAASLPLAKYPEDFFVSMGMVLSTTAVGYLFFGIVPAWFLISRSGRWARELTPDSLVEAEILPSLILSTGVLLLGFSFAVHGAVGVVIGSITRGVYALTSDIEVAPASSLNMNVLESLIWLCAGCLVYRWGTKALLRSA